MLEPHIILDEIFETHQKLPDDAFVDRLFFRVRETSPRGKFHSASKDEDGKYNCVCDVYYTYETLKSASELLVAPERWAPCLGSAAKKDIISSSFRRFSDLLHLFARWEQFKSFDIESAQSFGALLAAVREFLDLMFAFDATHYLTVHPISYAEADEPEIIEAFSKAVNNSFRKEAYEFLGLPSEPSAKDSLLFACTPSYSGTQKILQELDDLSNSTGSVPAQKFNESLDAACENFIFELLIGPKVIGEINRPGAPIYFKESILMLTGAEINKLDRFNERGTTALMNAPSGLTPEDIQLLQVLLRSRLEPGVSAFTSAVDALASGLKPAMLSFEALKKMS